MIQCTIAQSQQWFQYYLEIPLKGLSILPEAGYRMESGSISQYLGRLSIGYRVSDKTSLAVGVTQLGYYTAGKKAFNEFRPHQEANLTYQLSPKFEWSHRLRVEERFFYNISAELRNTFNLRVRYNIQTTVVLFDWSQKVAGRSLQFLLSNELFLAAFDRPSISFNQNRILTGPIVNFSENWSLGLLYNGVIYQNETSDQIGIRHITWLQLNHLL